MRKELLVELLKTKHTVVFCRLPSDRHADVNYVADDVIRIDLKKGANPARSLLHECLHLKFPEMSETDVILAERSLWRRLNQYERWLVNHCLFRHIWKEGE